jgi:hypothetical protein
MSGGTVGRIDRGEVVCQFDEVWVLVVRSKCTCAFDIKWRNSCESVESRCYILMRDS